MSPPTVLRAAIWLRPLLGGSIEKVTAFLAAIDRHGLSVLPRTPPTGSSAPACICQLAGTATVFSSPSVSPDESTIVALSMSSALGYRPQRRSASRSSLSQCDIWHVSHGVASLGMARSVRQGPPIAPPCWPLGDFGVSVGW